MSACGECKACVLGDQKSYFTSRGIRDMNMSCDTTCIGNHYKDDTENVCRQCSPSIQCSTSLYVKDCSETRDMYCERCTQCAPGTYMHTPCGSSTDTVCMPCGSNQSSVSNQTFTKELPEHAQWANVEYETVEWDNLLVRQLQLPECSWICERGYIEDEIRQICKTCLHNCGVGEYVSDCTNATKWEGCSPCVKPVNSTFTSRGRETPASCAWKCNTGLDIVINGTCSQTQKDTETEPVKTCEKTGESCDTGMFLNTSVAVCECQSCAPLTTASLASFTPRMGCEWRCKYPYIRSNDTCLRLIDLMRMNIPTTAVIESTPEPMEWMTTSGYVEPVTKFWLVTRKGETVTINPMVVIASVIPFLVVLVMVTAMIVRG
jgi:hypothetical protein